MWRWGLRRLAGRREGCLGREVFRGLSESHAGLGCWKYESPLDLGEMGRIVNF